MPKNRINFTDDFVLRDGKIGIGTTNPTTKFQVTGELKVTSVGATTGEEITLKHYSSNGGSLAFESGENHLFSVSNQVDDLLYSINDLNGDPVFRVFTSGVTSTNTISAGSSITAGTLVQTPIVDFLSPGAGTSTKITAKHYTSNNGSLVFESGDQQLFSITNAADGLLYNFTNENADSVVAITTTGIVSFTNKLILGSRVNAFSTERMELQTYGIRDGALSINNSGGNQLFNVSNIPDADSEFKINQYNSSGIVSQNTATRNVFSVSVGGSVSSFYPINIGTGLTNDFPSNLTSRIVGPLSLVAPHSTATQVVKMVPKYSDLGAISFEAPVGTAQTDRGTQIFSISNNLTSTIFRVNDVNRNTIIEATASGNVGIGTTLPQTKFQVTGTTRITSVGSTPSEQIDIRHYRDISPQQVVGLNTNNRGAISFDSPAGISTDGVTFFPASLFAITNDPTGNIFSVGGYRYFSGSPYPAIDVTQSGRVGIGTTAPQVDFHINSNTLVTSNVGFGTSTPFVSLDVQSTSQFRNRVAFSQTGNPANNNVIDLTPISSGITSWAPTGGALVLTSNRTNDGVNRGQSFTVENNDECLFRINTVGFGLSTVSTPTNPINPVIDVNSSGDVKIFDTETKKIISTALPGYSSTLPGDGDIFRIDTYVTPFIGSFPTVSKAVRLDKFGLIEVSRNVRQIAGNTVIGSANSTGTANQNLQVIGGGYLSGNVGIGSTTPRTKLDVVGGINVSGIATIGLANTSAPISNSSFSFELTNNTTLTVRVRGTDGVVRTGIITLA